jgi:phosphatidate cytidylyltransferase
MTSKPALNNLQQRILTGVFGGAVFIGGIWFSDWTFGLIFLALTILGMREFYKLFTLKGFEPNYKVGILLGAGLFVLVFLIQKNYVSTSILYLLFPVLMLSWVAELFRKKPHPFINIALTLMAVMYVAAPFTVLVILSFMEGYYSWHIILGTIFLIWAADTGGYIFGKAFGRHKLFERISPGKTWEGWLGGSFLCLGVAYVLSLFLVNLDLVGWLGVKLLYPGGQFFHVIRAGYPIAANIIEPISGIGTVPGR